MDEFIKPGIPFPAWGGHESGGNLVIRSNANATVNGYVVPKLTVDQVINAYNTFVGGGLCIVTSADDNSHFAVNQADVISGEITIEFLYYNYMLLSYTVIGDDVEITHYDLRQN